MKIYLKLDGDIVRDVVAFPYEDWVEGETETFPPGFMCGWYRWKGYFQFDQALYDKIHGITQ